jgi:hypothetical protein
MEIVLQLENTSSTGNFYLQLMSEGKNRVETLNQ